MKLQDKAFVMLTVIICGTVAVSVIQEADAHISFNIKPQSGVTNFNNKTITVTVGETNEPAYSDEVHNLELILRDFNTKHPIPNAFRDTTNQSPGCKANVNACPQILWVDAYFVPKGITPSLDGVHCADPLKIKNVTEPNSSYTCDVSGAGVISSKNQAVRVQFGKPGYYQAKDQWYSQAGHTVYHIYGRVNYYNDTLVPVSVWTNGQNIKQASNGAAPLITTGSGGFGLHDRTQEFWPPNTQQPENIRDAMVKDRNYLQEIRDGINQLIAVMTGGPGTPIPAPSGYQ